MAQRKSPPSGQSSGTRPAGSKAGTGKTPAGKVSTSKTAAGKSTAGKVSTSKTSSSKTTGLAKPPVGRPPVRKPLSSRKGKSIVNQKQTPWGMIASTVAVVLFAAAVVIVVIVTHKSDSPAGGGYTHPEIAAAKQINGVIYKPEPNHTHIQGHIKYNSSPPVGGNHSQYWADCTGTVYKAPIANENAVHMLEHGAVWVTYNAKTLPADQLAVLEKYVSGIDRMALSPYPNLKTPISLQSWDYQLFIDKPNASDPRIAKFIAALKFNPTTTPESSATCSQPTFIQHPSTFGHPLWVPVSAGT
jgi:hypothetical protein